MIPMTNQMTTTIAPMRIAASLGERGRRLGPHRGGPVRRWVPKAYADPKTSGLTYTVKAGNQIFDIELK